MLSTRVLLRACLSEFGLEFFEAADGGAGYALAQAHKPSLIILDLWMPVLDGRSFLVKLRAEQSLAQTPVVLLSGDDFSAGEAAKEGGARTYTAKKPLEIAKLKAMVKEALALSR